MSKVVNSFISMRSRQLGRKIDQNMHLRERLLSAKAEYEKLMTDYAFEAAQRFLIKKGKPKLSNEEFTALQKRVKEVESEVGRLKDILSKD